MIWHPVGPDKWENESCDRAIARVYNGDRFTYETWSRRKSEEGPLWQLDVVLIHTFDEAAKVAEAR